MDIFAIVNQWADVWFSFVFYLVIDSTFVFAVVGLMWLAIRKRCSVQMGYYLFLLVLLKLVIPSQYSLPTIFLDFTPEPIEISEVGDVAGWPEPINTSRDTIEPKNEVISLPVVAKPSYENLTMQGYLLITWFVISFAFLVRLSWILWKTRFMIQNTIPLPVNQIPFNLDHLQLTAGIKGKVQWLTGDWVKSPMAYGYFRPRIVVPKDMKKEFTPNQIRWILLHELAHIHRGDFWVSLFQRFLLAFFFFNPLVWWVNSIIDKYREYACDDAALIGCKSPPKECAEGFLGMVIQINNLPAFTFATQCMINYETMINNRLMRILTKDRILQNRLSTGSILFLLCISLLILPVGMKIANADGMQWKPIFDDAENSPFNMVAQCMIYHPKYKAPMLFGGCDWELAPPYTWLWKDQKWKIISEDGPDRILAGLAYDPGLDQTVLYGGYNTIIGFIPNTYGSITRLWDGMNWAETDFNDTEIRAGAALVYFPEMNCIIRHGGADGNIELDSTTFFGDTYKWDGAHWIKLNCPGPKRAGHKLVYDSVRKKVVLFGGNDAPKGYPADTWEFDGVRWEQVATSGPQGRHWHAFAFDESRGKTVLFGGSVWVGYHADREDYWMGDTWEWDGTTWEEIDVYNAPGKAACPKMVYNPNIEKIVMYFPSGRGAGKNLGYEAINIEYVQETWEYGPLEPTGIQLAFWEWF